LRNVSYRATPNGVFSVAPQQYLRLVLTAQMFFAPVRCAGRRPSHSVSTLSRSPSLESRDDSSHGRVDAWGDGARWAEKRMLGRIPLIISSTSVKVKSRSIFDF